MINKAIRLSKALRNETAKRVPVIIILGIILLLWSNYTNGQKANQTLNKIAALGQQIKDLSQQNKQLSLDNKNLSTQLNDKTDNINKHVDCVVTLFLPNKPLPGASDIDDCKATFSASSASSPTMTDNQQAPKSSSPQPTPSPTPTQSNNQPQPPKKPNCAIDVVFIHVGKCQ